MPRVTLRYGGEDYVIRNTPEDTLGRLRLAIDGQMLDFELNDRTTLHIRVSEYTPIAVTTTDDADTQYTPPRPIGLAIDPDDELGPPPRF